VRSGEGKHSVPIEGFQAVCVLRFGINMKRNEKKCFRKNVYKEKGTLIMLRDLLNDEAGFIVSAELVLIATILVIGLIVGLSSIQHAIVAELNDVGDAIGALNQSYLFTGFSSQKTGTGGGVKAYTRGSVYMDTVDDCDNDQCDIACDRPVAEGPKT
jgi:Flp pilus assembly pilin Flp